MTIRHAINLSQRPLTTLAIAALGVALLGGSPAPAVAGSAAGLPFETRCSGWLANISTRGQVGGGDRVLIAGFIVERAPVTVALRALGPTLADRGVAGSLADPEIELFRGQVRVAANAGWNSAESAAELARRGLAPAHAREPALLVTLEPGEYSAIVRGAGGSEGVGMVEVFQTGGEGELSNLSTRGSVGTGDAVLIGGLIVKGGPTTVAIRALGPSLAAHGVTGALVDPTIELYQGQTRIAANDDWERAGFHDRISGVGQAPPDAREAVIVVRLNPGEYTAVVRGAAGATGVAMVEVFRVLDIAGPHVDLVEEAAVDVAGNAASNGRLVIDGGLGFAFDGVCDLVEEPPKSFDCKSVLTVLALDGPTAPRILGEYRNPDETILDLDIHDGHAYVLLHDSKTYFGPFTYRLAIMPIAKLAHMRPSDPPALAEVASMLLAEDPDTVGSFAAQVAIAEGRLFAVLPDAVGVFSLDSPESPAEIGRVDVRAVSIAASGTRLYVNLANPQIQGDGIQIFDVADPAAPVLVGSLPTGATSHPPLRVEGGRLLFVVEFGCRTFPEPEPACFIPRRGVAIYDVADPGHATQIARFGAFQGPHALTMVGDRLYLVDAGVVLVYDVTDPRHRPLGVYPLPRDFGSDEPSSSAGVRWDSVSDIAAVGDGLFALVRDPYPSARHSVRRLRVASCAVGVE
jgi:hypothetical protein